METKLNISSTCYKVQKIILGPNFLPGVGAPQIFSAPGLAVPKTATGCWSQLLRLVFGLPIRPVSYAFVHGHAFVHGLERSASLVNTAFINNGGGDAMKAARYWVRLNRSLEVVIWQIYTQTIFLFRIDCNQNKTKIKTNLILNDINQ